MTTANQYIQADMSKVHIYFTIYVTSRTLQPQTLTQNDRSPQAQTASGLTSWPRVGC